MSKLLMSWNDRFALIDHFRPSDEQTLGAFGLSQDELDTARSLRAAGTFSSNPNMDVTKYKHVFNASVAPTPLPKPPMQPVVTTISAVTATVTQSKGSATVHVKPESASRRLKEPQKRGRKGDKIITALAAVPTTPISVDGFMQEYGISLAVLRQSKRFIEKLDPTTAKSIGKVNVRQDKMTKQLMIWREIPA